MELNLDVEKINYMEMLYEKSVVQDEMTEVIVPDALPDAASIICTEGTAFLRGKDTDESGVLVNGVVEGTVLYVPEEADGLRKLDFVLPFEITAAAENVPEDSQLTAKISVKRIGTSILNPRKLSIQVEVLAEIRAYMPAESCVHRGGGMSEEVEVLEKSITAEVPAEVSEKTFTITDELTVSGSKPDVGEMLSVAPHIIEDEVKGIGNKLVVRGRVVTDVLYMPVDGDCPETVKFTSPFSQIIEFSCSCEDNAGDVILALTGTYVSRGMPNSNGETVLDIEIHGVAQCVAYKTVEAAYIADAYSTRYDLKTENKMITLPRVAGRFSVTKTVIGNAETPERPKDVIGISVKPGAASIHENEICAEIYVCVVYVCDNGRLYAVHKIVKAEAECDISTESKTVASVDWEGEAFVNIMGNTLEFRFPIRFSAMAMSTNGVETVSALAYDEDNQKDVSSLPSLIVYKTRGDDNLWILGKKYCSTEELILAANGLEGNASMPEGMTIVIPKKR